MGLSLIYYPLQEIYDLVEQTLVEFLQKRSRPQELQVLLALFGARDLHDGPEGFAGNFPDACIRGGYKVPSELLFSIVMV